MATTDLRQIRAVASNYFFWQGLRWIPMGLALIAMSLLLAGWIPVRREWRDWLVWPPLIAALWISGSVLGRYYRRRFGHASADERQHTRRTSIKWLVVYPAMVASMVIDMKVSLPLLVSGIVWGASIELYRRSTGGGRPHYVVAALLLAALGLAPLFSAIPAGKLGITLLVGVVGAIYVVGGILDHLALARILGEQTPVSE